MSEINETTFFKGFQFWTLPLSKNIWQFAVFVIGHDYWTEDEEDHQAYEQMTWYVQILFWQISYTWELR